MDLKGLIISQRSAKNALPSKEKPEQNSTFKHIQPWDVSRVGKQVKICILKIAHRFYKGIKTLDQNAIVFWEV